MLLAVGSSTDCGNDDCVCCSCCCCCGNMAVDELLAVVAGGVCAICNFFALPGESHCNHTVTCTVNMCSSLTDSARVDADTVCAAVVSKLNGNCDDDVVVVAGV